MTVMDNNNISPELCETINGSTWTKKRYNLANWLKQKQLDQKRETTQTTLTTCESGKLHPHVRITITLQAYTVGNNSAPD
eukprot:4662295-Amphidinium_carterae.1